MKKARNEHLSHGGAISPADEDLTPREARKNVEHIIEQAPGGVLPKEDDEEIDGSKDFVPKQEVKTKGIIINKLVSSD